MGRRGRPHRPRDYRLERLVAAGDVDAVVRELEGMAQSVAGGFFAPGLERQDLVQEARIGIAAAVDYKPGLGEFVGFAYMCAHRRTVTAVITARRKRHVPLNDAASLSSEPPGFAPGTTTWADVIASTVDAPVDVIIVADALARVRHGLHRLTAIERTSLGMLLGGCTYGEIAAALPLTAECGPATAKTVDNAIQRARNKLRAEADVEVAA